MSKYLNIKLLIIFCGCIPLALIVLLSIVSWQGLTKLVESSESVDHTHGVISDANEIKATAVDIQTGQRGYLLAGKDEFLEPYTQGKNNFYLQVDALKKKVADNPSQIKLLDELQNGIDQWIVKVVEPNIKTRKSVTLEKSMDHMANEIAKEKGGKFFGNFRIEIGKFVDTEEQLLKKRLSKVKITKNEVVKIEKMISEIALWEQRTLQVISDTKTISEAILGAETSMRGFLITGKDAFLQPYEKGIDEFDTLITNLSKIVSDDEDHSSSGQVQLLNNIKLHFNQWRQIVAKPMIELRRKIKYNDKALMNEIVNRVINAKDNKNFESIRFDINQFIEYERKLLVNRQTIKSDAIVKRINMRKSLDESIAWVDHTNSVLFEISKLSTYAINIETGARGFLLAGKIKFLEPYNTGKSDFNKQIDKIKKLVSDNP